MSGHMVPFSYRPKGPVAVGGGVVKSGMARYWLLGAALVLAVPARAIQAACVGDNCPVTMVDTIFYGYGTACSGLDWRFLRAVGTAESGLDPKNHTGKYVGLFQMDKDGCGDNLGDYKSFLSCSNLEDPEVNTAVAADRFDRYFRGRGDYPSILKTCPDNTPAEDMALAYIGHNNGPAVLKYVLRRHACKDKAIRKAVAGFYENNPHSRDDGKFLTDDGRLVDCAASSSAKYGVVGTKSYRCVNARWGIAKYDYGRRQVASVKGIERLYVPEVTERTAECPAVAGRRMFSHEEILASLESGAFKDAPTQFAETRVADGLRRSETRAADAYVKLYDGSGSWVNQSEKLVMYTPDLEPVSAPVAKSKSRRSEYDKPRTQLPVSFKTKSAEPPAPGL